MVKQKLSKSSRPFILTIKEKTIDVAIDLDIPFEKAKKFWFQFLN